MAEEGATRDEVYNFIREFTEKTKIPPTRREIAADVGISVSTAQYHVLSLAAMGRVKLLRGMSRGILIDES